MSDGHEEVAEITGSGSGCARARVCTPFRTPVTALVAGRARMRPLLTLAIYTCIGTFVCVCARGCTACVFACVCFVCLRVCVSA